MQNFYRLNEDGNAQIFDPEGGIVTSLDENIYPIDSNLSARYEHSLGIVLLVEVAEAIGIKEEAT